MKETLVTDKPLVVGFAYTPPSNSSIHEQCENSLFEVNGEEILDYHKLG